AIMHSTIDNLDIICSRIDLVGAEVELMSRRDRERILQRLLEPVKDDYDFILIDCSPSLGVITINALTASNSVLIPVQAEYF
ncbi:MAG TPA: chromosome partitioning protein ParA, partial [Porphyromonadaceae bacterium]|nr:chromosome partitioning protein ParA [Porphyromonadaceae bacterium]